MWYVLYVHTIFLAILVRKLVIYPKKGYNKTRIYKGDELK